MGNYKVNIVDGSRRTYESGAVKYHVQLIDIKEEKVVKESENLTLSKRQESDDTKFTKAIKGWKKQAVETLETEEVSREDFSLEN